MFRVMTPVLDYNNAVLQEKWMCNFDKKKILLAELNFGSVLASVHKSQLFHVLDLLVQPRTICAPFMCEYD